MRKFKFRVWYKKENRWLDPWAEEDPILSLKDYGDGCEVFTYSRERKTYDNLDCLMKDVIIQQYTGLKDIDHKDIYEGDIVSIGLNGPLETSKQTTGIIIWDDEEACFGIQTKVVDEDVIWGFMYTELKVIGNIFEGEY